MFIARKLVSLFVLSLLVCSVSACTAEESMPMLPLLPPSVCPTYDYALITLDTPLPLGVAQELIGLTENEAALCAASLNWGFRVGARDGEYFALTMDYRTDRVNVIVKEGIVTSVDVG